MIRRVGFACVTHGLGWSTSHTLRLANLSQGRLEAVVRKNVADLLSILEWMDGAGLRLFRIGSSFIPFASHEAMTLDWESPFAREFAAIGGKFAALGFRFSMHPGQYNVLNSLNPEVVRRTMAEIAYSCRVLDLMGLDRSHKVVIHGGCAGGDRTAGLERLRQVAGTLPRNIRERLVLENDERIFNFSEIVQISESTGLPAVFDLHHHRINPCDDVTSWLKRAGKVWDCRPKVHISSQKPGGRPGAHDLFIAQCDLAALLDVLPFDADLMVEAKAKEEAALKVLGMLGGAGT